MITVDLDKIVTAKGLQQHLASILYEVEEEERVYIITKQGKPKAALINVDYLLELTGKRLDGAEEYAHYDRHIEPDDEPSPPQLDKLAVSEVAGAEQALSVRRDIGPGEAADSPIDSEAAEPTVIAAATPTEAAPAPEPIKAPAIAALEQLSTDGLGEPTDNPYEIIEEETAVPPPTVDTPPAPTAITGYDQNGLPVVEPVIAGQPDLTDQAAAEDLPPAAPAPATVPPTTPPN